MPAAEAHRLRFRPGTKFDHAFVIKTWLRTYNAKKEVERTGDERIDLFDEIQHARIELFLLQASLVIAHGADPDVIEGFVVARPDHEIDGKPVGPVVHYVFVRHEVRKQGIARALLNGIDSFLYTHQTNDLRSLIRRGKLPHAKYDPRAR